MRGSQIELNKCLWKPMLVLCLVISSAITDIALAGDYSDAVEEFEAENYASALAKFQKVAASKEPVLTIEQCLAGQRYAHLPVARQHEVCEAQRFVTKYERAHAAAMLGLMSQYGYGIDKDYTKAAKFYAEAAEQDFTRAKYMLGSMYEKGHDVPKDYNRAALWYRKAAEAGNTPAQVRLGLLYALGHGTPKDLQQAVLWFRKAAEAGDSQGQQHLGVALLTGEGVTQNYQEAALWSRKAADAGDAVAQFYLALIYQEGKGVEQDFKEAARWYKKSAETGIAAAQNQLATLYVSGNGVSQDFVLAHMWANLAATNHTEYVATRDAIARRMTAHQIGEAQQLARQWKPQKESVPSFVVEAAPFRASGTNAETPLIDGTNERSHVGAFSADKGSL